VNQGPLVFHETVLNYVGGLAVGLELLQVIVLPYPTNSGHMVTKSDQLTVSVNQGLAFDKPRCRVVVAAGEPLVDPGLGDLAMLLPDGFVSLERLVLGHTAAAADQEHQYD